MSDLTTQPGPVETPPGQPRKRWHQRWSVRIPALAAVLVIGAGIAGAAAGHPAPAPPKPAASTMPSPPPAPPGSSAPTDTAPPAPSGPDELAAGQTEILGNDADATIGTLTVGHPAVTTWPAQSYGEKPANGYYVVVKVTAKADPSYHDGWFVSPLDLHAVVGGQHYDEGNGHAFEALTDAQSSTDLSATLSAGETVTGYIAFDVPSAHGKIVYAPNFDGQPIAEWSY
jgi:hypothetical protein